MPAGKIFGCLFLCILLILSCKKEGVKPDGFNADFNVTFSNGGMVPDSVIFSAVYPGAENYSWDIEGINVLGSDIGIKFNAAGVFNAKLEVRSGSNKESESTSIRLENFPPGGSTASVIDSNGVVYTIVLTANSPNLLPVDTIDNSAARGGLDYDQERKKLYYTKSVQVANPNGTEKAEVLPSAPNQIVRDVLIDEEENLIYYSLSDPNIHQLFTMNFNGNQQEIVLNSQNSIDFFELNKKDDVIFTLSDESPDINLNIYIPQVDSFLPVPIPDLTEEQKFSLAWDNQNESLYFTERATTQLGFFNIIKCKLTIDLQLNLPPSVEINVELEKIVENASSLPILGMDLDEKNNTLYWTDQVEGAIFKLDLTNPNASPKIVFKGISKPGAIAIGNFEE